jgi:hypothetical protein
MSGSLHHLLFGSKVHLEWLCADAGQVLGLAIWRICLVRVLQALAVAVLLKILVPVCVTLIARYFV